jgi:hypothetical protein
LKQQKQDHQKWQSAFVAPWSAASFPSGVKWLKRNEKPLELVVAASKRPRFFCPLNPAGKSGLLIGSNVLAHFDFSRAGSALCVRAMLRLKEGKVAEAREDLMAARRLAFLVAHHLDESFWLSAERLEQNAMNGLLALNHFAPPSAAEAREFDRLVQEASTLQQDRSFPLARYEFLDATCHMISDIEKEKTFVDRLAGRALVDPLFTRWNDALRFGNAFYDRVAIAENNSDGKERAALLQAIDQEIKVMGEKTKFLSEKAGTFRYLPRPFWSSPRGAWGRAMHDSIQSMLSPITCPLIVCKTTPSRAGNFIASPRRSAFIVPTTVPTRNASKIWSRTIC